MRKELRERIFAFNRERAADKETAKDLRKLLEMLPSGIMKQILRDEKSAAILAKYGFEVTE